MIYTVDWLEVKPTSTGKVRAMATLIDEMGAKVPNVTIWSDFPSFNEIRPGGKIQGTIKTVTKNGKAWTSLYAAKNPNGTYRPANPTTTVVKLQQEGIAHAQDKKMEGIKDSSTFRAASESTIQWRQERMARGLATTADEWQAEWIRSRKWFDERFSEPFN